MLVFFFAGKQPTLGNNGVEGAERLLVWLCCTFPPRITVRLPPQCHGQTAGLWDQSNRIPPGNIPETTHTLWLTHAASLQFTLQTVTIDVNYLHLSEMMEVHSPTSPKRVVPLRKPQTHLPVSHSISKCNLMANSIASSTQICLVTDTVAVASSNLFLGEIMKHRHLCFKIF